MWVKTEENKLIKLEDAKLLMVNYYFDNVWIEVYLDNHIEVYNSTTGVRNLKIVTFNSKEKAQKCLDYIFEAMKNNINCLDINLIKTQIEGE